MIVAIASNMSADAGTPEVISFQGRLTDNADNPLSGNFNVTFSIYADEFGGSALWTETQMVPASDGNFKALMGALTPLTQSVFSDSVRWLGIKVESDAEMPRTRMTSSPFAYRIATVDGSVSTLLVLEAANSTRVELGVGANVMQVFDSTGALRVKLAIEGGTGARGLDGGGAISFFRPSAVKNADGRAGSVNLVRIGESVYGSGELTIHDTLGNMLAQMTTTSVDGGAYYTYLPDSTKVTIQGQATDSGGYIGTWGINGNRQVALSSLVGYPGHGYVSTFDPDGIQTAGMYSDAEYTGHIKTYDYYGHKMVEIHKTNFDPEVNGGVVDVFGSNGNLNVSLTHTPNWGNSGRIEVLDSFGVAQAGIYVDSAGTGYVWGDVKAFATANPNQPGTELWYAALEGPEAAAYYRGTAGLVDGTAKVEFPDYFSSIVSEKGMTVQIVPLSANSKGLAVTQKHVDYIVVQELMNGKGSYNFDFTVTAVRKGFEDYEIIRPVAERPAQDRVSRSEDEGPSRIRSEELRSEKSNR